MFLSPPRGCGGSQFFFNHFPAYYLNKHRQISYFWQGYAGTPVNIFANFHTSGKSTKRSAGLHTISLRGLNQTVLIVPNPVSNCMHPRYKKIFIQSWFQSYLVRIVCFIWPCTHKEGVGWSLVTYCFFLCIWTLYPCRLLFLLLIEVNVIRLTHSWI